MPKAKKINPHTNKDAVKARLLKTLASKKPFFICLTMIVRNEQNNMERLLESLKWNDGSLFVHGVCICDNAPIEDTQCQDIVTRWCQNHNLPLQYHRVPWVNFGVNRTQSVALAKRNFPQATNFLLSDADFVWVLGDKNKFDSKALVMDIYRVKQTSPSQDHWNARILSARLDWVCKGRTHEYWKAVDDSRVTATHDCKAIYIDDRNDGGFKAHKFTRDLQFLEEDYNDPTTDKFDKLRSAFYLGCTNKNLGNYAKAIEWFKIRISTKGWIEEYYFAHYEIGKCYEQMGFSQFELWKVQAAVENNDESFMARYGGRDKCLERIQTYNPNGVTEIEMEDLSQKSFASAREWYLKGYRIRKTRGEALYALIRLLRVFGNSQEALEHAMIGALIPTPSDTLFVETALYPDAFEMEIAYNCGILGKIKDGMPYAELLMMKYHDYPDWIKNDIPRILNFYNLSFNV